MKLLAVATGVIGAATGLALFLFGCFYITVMADFPVPGPEPIDRTSINPMDYVILAGISFIPAFAGIGLGVLIWMCASRYERRTGRKFS